MLKFLLLNRRRIPVPVPIKTLSEAIHWIESSLIKKDHSITRIELDGDDVDPFMIDHAVYQQTKLGLESRLVVQVDSPNEICVQTIDAIKNLTIAIERSLKPIAVDCWQSLPKVQPTDLAMLLSDLNLCQDLVKQVFVLLSGRAIQTTNLSNLSLILDQHCQHLAVSVEKSEWKITAKILLQQLEPFLKEFGEELAYLQKAIFENVAEESFARARDA